MFKLDKQWVEAKAWLHRTGIPDEVNQARVKANNQINELNQQAGTAQYRGRKSFILRCPIALLGNLRPKCIQGQSTDVSSSPTESDPPTLVNQSQKSNQRTGQYRRGWAHIYYRAFFGIYR